MKSTTKYFIFIVLIGSFILFSCNQSNEAQPSNMGIIKFQITDAPFPVEMLEKAEITVSKLELKDAKGGDKYINVFNEETKIDLLKLSNGVTQFLGEIEVPEGNYSEVRFFVTQTILKFRNQQEFNFKIPSSLQSGIKILISPSIMVNRDIVTEVLLDFDLSQSFVVNGPIDDINNYIFKPVIRAVNNTVAGSLVGKVTDSNKKAFMNVQVTVMNGNSVITSSYSDKNGDYKIIGLLEGTYTIKGISSVETKTFNNIKIKKQEETNFSFSIKREEIEEH